MLILAYGRSETNEPPYDWSKINEKTIREYFDELQIPPPERYGNSMVYKVYNVNDLPEKEVLNKDLDQLIDEYLSLDIKKNKNNVQLNPINFLEDLSKAGLIFSRKLATRFIASLQTKPFVILTGLSGSGKTKLAQSFTQWICADQNQWRIVPVGADWINREPLLGYPNALNREEYVKPDNGTLDLLIHAVQTPELPHFLILDEMNLSHVERYFADFLSVMESGEPIPLFSGEGEIGDVPPEIRLPSNLYIIGTVNVDETTYMFSPKVLDRANTIEFRITPDEMSDFLNTSPELNMGALSGKGADMAMDFLTTSHEKKREENDDINKILVKFFKQLSKTGTEFGYRSATEIHHLTHRLSALDPDMSVNDRLDVAVLQKLLPKLHGSRRKLCPALENLGKLCLSDTSIPVSTEVFAKDSFQIKGNPKVIFPLSLEKIKRMYNNAIDNGFTAFAEA